MNTTQSDSPSDVVRSLVPALLAQGRLYVAANWHSRIDHVPRETQRWEVFRGHLLTAVQTRQQAEHEIWHIIAGPAEDLQPLVSVRWDARLGQLYVTRKLLVHAWEAYESSPSVIECRQVERWQSELVGTVRFHELTNSDELRRQIECLLTCAVVGTSRLAITSVESPLPAFSLGRLAYFPLDRPEESSLRSPQELTRLACQLNRPQVVRTRLLEMALRTASPDDVPEMSGILTSEHTDAHPGTPAALVAGMFHHIALSPYTKFVDRLAALLGELAASDRLGPAAVVDLTGLLIRQLVRHLTAFDLVTFHNIGANYPDALLLDALLRRYIALLDEHPYLFADGSDNQERQLRLHRRALRQAVLARKSCEGLRVPEMPTSPGENLRVLPPEFPHLSDDELTVRAARRKVLFDGQPLKEYLTPAARQVLQAACLDMQHALERRELGMALFLDRPLGVLKAAGEVDRTPLLSYMAYSKSIARARLRQLRDWPLTAESIAQLALPGDEAAPDVHGLAISDIPGDPRPGVVSLADAALAAHDFVLLRTTRRSVAELLSQYELSPLAAAAPQIAQWLQSEEPILLVRTALDGAAPNESLQLTAFDAAIHPRLVLTPARSTGATPYGESMASEYLRGGLHVMAFDSGDASGPEQTVQPRDVSEQNLVLPPTRRSHNWDGL